MEQEKRIKRRPPGPRGYEVINNKKYGIKPTGDGNWLIYLNNRGQNLRAVVPAEVAKLIKVGLYIQERSRRVLREMFPLSQLIIRVWYLITGGEFIPNSELANEINCHYTVAYLDPSVKFDFHSEKFSSGNVNLLKPRSAYFGAQSYSDLLHYFQEQLSGDSWGIGQIGRNMPGEGFIAVHSFLVFKTMTDDFLCFEKVGYYYQFHLIDLKSVFKRYLGCFIGKPLEKNLSFYVIMPATEVQNKIMTSDFQWKR